MKIGIDTRLWGETGVGRYIRNLVSELSKIDFKNSYVLFALNKNEKNIKSAIRNSQFVIRLTDIKWHTLEEQLKFPAILNKENLDLIHFPYFSVPALYNKPFVFTIHDLIIDHFPTGQASALPFPIYNLKRLAYNLVLSYAAKKAKKIITVSNATKDEIIDHLKVNPEKVAVTYEGVDDRISNIKYQKSKIDSEYFLCVGNAYPHKNLERLLEAFKILDNDTKLVLVGKEDYFYKRLRSKVAGMRLSDKTILLQNVADEELSSLYQNAKALILPSLMEGFGLPALEAMANKCLVLASDIPSLREICGNAALYFNPLSIDELTKKLNMVTSHTTGYGRLEEIRKRGIERVKLFSWRKMARKTLKIYESSSSASRRYPEGHSE
ncbi:MAG: hypothetical protein A3B47_00195 [Candidatus Levybacteria bacterium RIFCSPLOWO2_01_FULL_39_24]|nr:MAG: hypothetical protein A2800_00995 [Candidatus Levybacteria bacterium RIFCSPHIGHO2_01_FULL_40_16]OGH46196.1 MAG: hypothetical protein A3B47_00195 [Candidatus Levybacteria bacterium RIFCSPLOWO2_01_FULL_39_24]